MSAIHGEVSEISFNGRPFSVDSKSCFELGSQLHSLFLDNKTKYRKVSSLSSGSIEFDLLPLPITPRRNGKPWSRRAMKKKANNPWKILKKLARRQC